MVFHRSDNSFNTKLSPICY